MADVKDVDGVLARLTHWQLLLHLSKSERTVMGDGKARANSSALAWLIRLDATDNG
jgi:hypothetical protein